MPRPMPPEAPMLTFYYATNTCALASHIALEEAGAADETRWVDFGVAEQTKPDYLEINPKARVPSLATERGV
jgi:glutathione S-transferase